MSSLSPKELRSAARSANFNAFSESLLMGFLNQANHPEQLTNFVANGSNTPDLGGKEVLIRSFGLPMHLAEALIAFRHGPCLHIDKLERLSELPGLELEHLRRLFAAFMCPDIKLEGLRFAISAKGEPMDAIPLRFNLEKEVQAPEWSLNARFRRTEESPVCYSVKSTLGKRIVIQAKFSGPPNQRVVVKARNFADDELGVPNFSPIQFDAEGKSDWTNIELVGTRIHIRGVAIYDVHWDWQFAFEESGPYASIGMVTRHRVYVVLEQPKAPWTTMQGSDQNPWQQALELACTWAWGAKDLDEAAAAICRAHNSTGFKYLGLPSYTTPDDFFLSDYLEKVNDFEGSVLPVFVNCSDCAALVSTLANLLGHELWQAKMGKKGKAFRYRDIVPIGGMAPVSGEFFFHEVAWKGQCEEDDALFDACLHLSYGDLKLLPLDMVFGDCNSGGYRQLFAHSALTGCLNCGTQYDERIRRRLI